MLFALEQGSSLLPTVIWQPPGLKPTDVKQIVLEKIRALFLVSFLCENIGYSKCMLVDLKDSAVFL